MNVLANDGISVEGVEKLNQAGFNVTTESISQEEIVDYINTNNIEVLLVRSATKARKDLIDECPELKIIGRGGVGMDNIDVEYAKNKNIHVINTPAASSISVAELVFAHLFSCVRKLYQSNRSMPLEGDSNFKKLKKSYAGGIELKGKTLGIIGFGRIGQEVAKIAIGSALEIFSKMKMIVSYMDSISHDKHIAYVSHLSHLSSFMLGKTVMDEEESEKNIFDMAGSGFESTVRLAKSSPKMWTDIFDDNKANVLKSLSDYINNLELIKDLIESNKFEELESQLKKTNYIKKILKGIN